MLKLESLIFNPFSENTFIVYDETNECVIVDPGCTNAAEEDRLFGFIDSHQLKPLMVINTHGHVDHVVGNNAVKRRYGIKVAAHLDMHHDFTQAKRQAVWLGMQPEGDIDLPDIDLQDDQEIKVGNGILEVICTPGHAKGSISLYAPAEGWVITGDALFCRSIGRTDLPGGNFEELRESIRTRLFSLPNETEVFPGHGESTTIGEEKDFNPFVAV
ncbi:MAG: MBL fold metallo-hydrolase [Bacteroidales bacterium]|jgi:glyoxylase-like metal-dependent hydrolase (beta-lactamase superfamily II)|nr:MBL fold metallo-hydrolase [Bacteroidales bacterium]